MATSIGAGVGSAVTIGKETTYGTFIAGTRGYEHESESLEWKPTRTRAKSIYNNGIVPRASGRQTTTATVDGDVVGPVYTKGMGLWLGMVFGTLTTTPVLVSSGAYLQTHTLAVNNVGQSCSIQVARPDMLTATDNPYSYLGCKASKVVFEAKINEPVRMTLTVDAKDVTEAQTFTVPTYQTANPPFFFNQGAFSMGAFGSEVAKEGVRSFTLTLERKMRVDNFYLDGTGRKQEPVPNDYMVATVDLETDFRVKADFADVFYADTPQSIIFTATGSIIGGSNPYQLTFKLPQCRFNSEPPKVAGLDIIQPKMSADVEYDDTNAPVTCLYQSTDTTL